MPTFSTSFSPPPALTSLTIEADLPTSKVSLEWSPTALAPEDFGGYKVYRRLGSDAWVLLASFSSSAQVTYEDFEAPLNTSVGYRVTQSNLDYESAPVEGLTELASLAWWIVMPHDPSLTFPISNVHNASLIRPKIQDEFSPIGRPGKVVVGDVVQAEDGQLSFRILPDQPQHLALLRRIQEHMDGAIILKAPDGYIHEVQFASITRSFTKVAGWQELTLPFVGAS